MGNIASSRTGSELAINYEYDATGKMLGLTDQTGSQTTFAYDGRGLVTGRTDALGRTTRRTYYDDDSLWTATARPQRSATRRAAK